MKAIAWYAPRDLRMTEVEPPLPESHEALIRIESVGLCGSDLHYYESGAIGESSIEPGLILGHEYAGIVEAVGAQGPVELIGQRVAVEPGIPCMKCEWCRSGHYNVCLSMVFPGGPGHPGALCEYKTVHTDFCFPVPDTFSASEAALIEPLAVALHSVELACIKPGESVAVLGLGPIGLLTAQLAKVAGAGDVFGTDRLEYRVNAGARYGVDYAFNAAKQDTVEVILRATQQRGVDVAFDTARSSETAALACRVARPAGRCVLTGISGNETDVLPVTNARRKELSIYWCRRFLNNFPRAIALVASGRVDVRSLITHTFSLEQTPRAFALLSQFEDNVLKVAIENA